MDTNEINSTFNRNLIKNVQKAPTANIEEKQDRFSQACSTFAGYFILAIKACVSFLTYPFRKAYNYFVNKDEQQIKDHKITAVEAQYNQELNSDNDADNTNNTATPSLQTAQLENSTLQPEQSSQPLNDAQDTGNTNNTATPSLQTAQLENSTVQPEQSPQPLNDTQNTSNTNNTAAPSLQTAQLENSTVQPEQSPQPLNDAQDTSNTNNTVTPSLQTVQLENSTVQPEQSPQPLNDTQIATPVEQSLADNPLTTATTTIASSNKLSKKFANFARKKAKSQTNNELSPIMLPLGTKHAEEFNEAVRRLPKKVVSQIQEKLPQVTDDDIQKIVEIRYNPKSLLSDHLTFFKDDNTRYVLLKAFKLEKISTQQFFTLMSWYHEARTNEILDCLPLYDETADGLVVNDKSWDVLSDSISSLETCNYLPELKDTYDVKQGIRTNRAHLIKSLQNTMQHFEPLDRVIFTFKKKNIEDKFLAIASDRFGNTMYLEDLYDDFLEFAKFPVFYSPSVIITPNFELLNLIIETIFGKDAISANLVLGSSTPDDIRKGMKNNYRDIGVHFEDPKLPTTIHWGTVNYSIDHPMHDIYHLFVCLHTANSTHMLLEETGSELHKLADNRNQLIEDTLEKARNIKLPVDTLENRTKSVNSLVGLHKFLSYLKKSRIALNLHDFMLYDGNFSTIDENKSTLRGILTTHIKDLKKSFIDHDPQHMRDFVTPFNMKQICKVVGLQLEEQFNYLVKNHLIENNKYEFARTLYQATWNALKHTIEDARPISKSSFQDSEDFNQYNFIACMQEYLLENYPLLNHKEDIKFVATDNNGSNYLHDHTNTISAEEFQYQIDSGIDLNSKNNQGDTILHILAKTKLEDRHEDYSTIIDTLINSGINLNIQNNEGETALHCAIKNNGLSNDAQKLINSDMNFTIRDNKNMTAMDYVLRYQIKKYFQADLIPENIEILWTRNYIKWKPKK
jgi:hypothetical protein